MQYNQRSGKKNNKPDMDYILYTRNAMQKKKMLV